MGVTSYTSVTVGPTCSPSGPYTYDPIEVIYYGGGTQYLYHESAIGVGPIFSKYAYDAGGSIYAMLFIPDATVTPEGCVYEASFQQWSYSRSKPPTYFTKTSTTPQLTLSADTTYATDVRMYYKFRFAYRPLRITLSGPNQVSDAGTHTWSVDPDYGRTPYSISWEKSENGGASWAPICSGGFDCPLTLGSSSADFSIRVTVQDRDLTRIAVIPVNVDIVAGPPVSVSVHGPSTVNVGDECLWWASASGGTPPFTFSWSGLSWGTGSYVSFVSQQSGWLSVRVDDAANQSAQNSIWVTADPTGSQMMCFH